MNDFDIIAELYTEILEEGTASHTSVKDIEELLDVIKNVNEYYRVNKIPDIARVEEGGGKISIYPNDGTGRLFNFHSGQDKHPVRRAVRSILKNDLENIKKFVDRKYARQYIQPILTGN